MSRETETIAQLAEVRDHLFTIVLALTRTPGSGVDDANDMVKKILELVSVNDLRRTDS